MIQTLLLALVLNSPVVPAQAVTADERRSLSGLSGVDVVVEHLDAAALAEGLTTDQLKTEAQQKLTSAGIKVSPKYESYLDIELTYVNLTDKTRSSLNLGYTASVMISLKQLVNLSRHKGISTWARTWHRKMLIFGPPGQGKENVKGAVDDLVGQFLDDYLTTNPKS